MTAERPDSIETTAILWHIRLRDGDDATWADFVEWLAEDPRHRLTYDRVEAADQALDPLLADVIFREAANDAAANARFHPSPRWHGLGRGALVGGLLAASLAAVLLLGPPFSSSRYDVATAPGEHRQIALDATTMITLNGSTRITLDRKDKRFAALATGEALFQVRHDAAHPFTLVLGDRRVVDLGTLFDVVRDTGGVRLAVAQGKVAYQPNGQAAGGQRVPVAAGQALSDLAGADTIRLTEAPAGSVGGWRTGRLVYASASLAEVAGDIGRTLGLRITVAPAIARQPVSGSIALAGSGAEEAHRLGKVLDVTIVTGADGWTMQPPGSDAH